MRPKKFRYPEYVLLFTAICLSTSWIICYLFDVKNALNLADRLLSTGFEAPFMWFHLFNQGAPIEILQWIMLAACVLCCGILSEREKSNDKDRRAMFFVLIGIGLCLMLLEDAADIRFDIASYADFFFTQSDARGLAGTITELAIYALIAGFMIFPILRYWGALRLKGKSLLYLGMGYLMYAVSSIMSASSGFQDWYARAGTAIVEFLPINNIGAWELTDMVFQEHGRNPLGFYLIDFVIEESLELIGAAFILAFLLYTIEVTNSPRTTDRTPGKRVN